MNITVFHSLCDRFGGFTAGGAVGDAVSGALHGKHIFDFLAFPLGNTHILEMAVGTPPTELTFVSPELEDRRSGG